MKAKHLLFAGLSTAAMAVTAIAQTTVINITGATAFREAAHNAIRASYTSVQYGHTGTTFASSNQSIFSGTFPGIAGTTIVRTFWTGAAEGVRDVVQENLVPFLATNSTVSANPGTPNLAPGTDPGVAHFAFSDCFQSSTPFQNPTLGGGPVGVIVFAMLTNEMAPTNPSFAGYGRFNNVTALQYRAMVTNGFVPLSQFTGDNADDGLNVYATGRADSSGTRTIYLIETGHGASELVNQYKLTSASNNLTDIRIWPLNDLESPTVDNRSLIWNADTPGNGGYFSGSALRGFMDDTSASVNVRDPDNNILAAAQNVLVLTSISAVDAAAVIPTGAKALAYNGVAITPRTAAAGGLDAADRAKIQNGSYSLWSYEHLYFNQGDITANETIFYNALVTAVPGNIGGNGITLTELAGSGRADDGEVIFQP